MRELILRGFAKRKVRTFLTILGVMIGIGLIVSLMSIIEGLGAEADKTLKMGTPGIIISNKYFYITDSYLDKVENDEEIRPYGVLANPSVSFLASTLDGESVTNRWKRIIPITLRGYDAEKIEDALSDRMPQLMKEGRFLKQEDTFSAVVAKPIADEFDIKCGSTINVNGTEFEVVGIHETGLMLDLILDDSSIVIPLERAQEMRRLKKNEYTNILVTVENPEDIDRVAEMIEPVLGGDIEVLTTGKVATQFSEFKSILEKATWAIGSVAAIVGGLGIVNSMAMNVMERRREIGILKAVGWTKSEVLRTFLLESLFMGFLGGIGGLALGVLGVLVIKGILPGVLWQITPELILAVMIFALFLGAAGGLYPAWRATEVDPVEALRYG